MKLALVEKPWSISCEIETLVAGARARDLGAALVATAERFAADSGAAGIRVDVLSANPVGRSFYERLGYGEFAVRYGKPVPGHSKVRREQALRETDEDERGGDRDAHP